MRHLVIGAGGQVGEFLIKEIIKKNEEVIGTFFNNSLFNSKDIHSNLPGKYLKLDICDLNKVQKTINEVNPDVIYVPAANTNVDYCELNEIESNKTNIIGIQNIVCAINNIKDKNKSKKEPLLIFYSTDYIFDGKLGLYTEKSLPNPINVYGEQKLLCEQFIQNYSKHFIIIRTTGVFGPESQGKNFVTRLVKNLRANKEAAIPDDEYGTPTYAPDLANITLKLVDNLGHGLRNEVNNIINVAGRDYISRYKFALNIAEIFNCNKNLVLPTKSAKLARAANRPLLGGLDIDLIENLIDKKVINHIDGLINMKKILHDRFESI